MEKGKTITVKGIEQIATGNKNGKQWTMYKVTDQDDNEYKTFDVMTLGSPYQISYEEEPKKPFVAKKGEKAGQMITPTGVDRFIKRAVITDAPPMTPNTQSGTGQQVITLESLQRQINEIKARLDTPEVPF